MKTKTFNIGESCLYGTIRVTLNDFRYKVEVMDYKTKNVRENESFHIVDKFSMHNYLESFTTPYYADKVISHFYL